MAEIVKRFSDGSFLEYDNGKFDEWCVYLTNASGNRKAPRDTEYFAQLKSLAEKFGTEKVYGDYVTIYENTGKQVSDETMAKITEISKGYGESALSVDIIFSILHMAMIAEERKAYTRLGKRIKRLGIHKLLKEDCSVDHSANFMRGMRWQEIDSLCKERGF